MSVCFTVLETVDDAVFPTSVVPLAPLTADVLLSPVAVETCSRVFGEVPVVVGSGRAVSVEEIPVAVFVAIVDSKVYTDVVGYCGEVVVPGSEIPHVLEMQDYIEITEKLQR